MNNYKKIFKFQIFSIIFTSILGTLIHFTYEWSNNNQFVGLFSAINESTWEHLKLIYFPMLITTIIGYFYLGKEVPNFLCAKSIGIVLSMLFTVIFFYTYSGILGKNIDFINILTFYIAVFIGEYIASKIMLSNFVCNDKIALFILIILLLCFIIFTFHPPKIGLFKEPII